MQCEECTVAGVHIYPSLSVLEAMAFDLVRWPLVDTPPPCHHLPRHVKQSSHGHLMISALPCSLRSLHRRPPPPPSLPHHNGYHVTSLVEHLRTITCMACRPRLVKQCVTPFQDDIAYNPLMHRCSCKLWLCHALFTA